MTDQRRGKKKCIQRVLSGTGRSSTTRPLLAVLSPLAGRRGTGLLRGRKKGGYRWGSRGGLFARRRGGRGIHALALPPRRRRALAGPRGIAHFALLEVHRVTEGARRTSPPSCLRLRERQYLARSRFGMRTRCPTGRCHRTRRRQARPPKKRLHGSLAVLPRRDDAVLSLVLDAVHLRRYHILVQHLILVLELKEDPPGPREWNSKIKPGLGSRVGRQDGWHPVVHV
mmetsp:Transcript_36129/g.101791  ORF Transcript_36129/g.101791 Transcript_36129/m.101791 type:complete len:227 (-) Transcript_36129:509-1189(-)